MSSPDDLTAAEHLEGLGRNVRRANGQVYTPQPLADFVLRQATLRGGMPAGVMLDPACGGGVFLISSVRYLARACKRIGLDITGTHRNEFLRQVQDTVWGIDVDPVAVRLSREAIFSEVLRISPGPLANDHFDANVVHADFLFDDVINFLPEPPALVVGNPPYVAIDRLDEKTKVRIRESFPLAQGRIDLYTVFMERSATLLKSGGRMTFITPDKFIASESSRSLRSFLGEIGTVRSLTLFASHRVFGNAATVPCVMVWDRTRDEQRVTITHAYINTVEEPKTTGLTQRIPASRLKGSRWQISRAKSESLGARLKRDHVSLSEVTSRISAGPATGYNPAFILTSNTANENEIEQALLHPTIRGRDVQRGLIRDSQQVMLVPYTVDDSDSLRLIDLENFPAAHVWLEKHKPALLKRHCVRDWGKEWWDLHDPITIPLGNTQKIVFPDVAKSNRFALDQGRFIPQHSAYFLIPKGVDARYLTALLNSSCTEYLVRSHAPVVKDGFSRYRKQFLLDLPIPIPSPSAQSEIALALEEDRKDTLDKLVADLFNVDAAEVEDALNELPIARD